MSNQPGKIPAQHVQNKCLGIAPRVLRMKSALEERCRFAHYPTDCTHASSRLGRVCLQLLRLVVRNKRIHNRLQLA